jgi:acyl-CoA synthetase (AMP-forming)/AMP-acid ligase II
MEFAVLAIPDELVTNRLVAYLTTRDGTTVDEVAQFCADQLPRYMVPESFNLLAELPKTSTGQLDRRSLFAAG